MVLGLLTVTEATLLALELLEEISGFVEKKGGSGGTFFFFCLQFDMTYNFLTEKKWDQLHAWI